VNSLMVCRLKLLVLSLGLALASGPAWADENVDPWESFNRKVFAFNETADRFVLRPATSAYRFVTPRFVQRGVSNAFSNVMDVPSAVNGLLQGKPRSAGRDLGRFVINSTLGVAGLWDVAQHMGLESRDQEDFGQTLAVWGVNQGPYLVLPFLGPSTLRDTVALPVDWATDPLLYIDHTRTRYSAVALYQVDRRSQLMELEEHVIGDRYVFIRDAYLQRREYLIHDGEVEDDFGGDFDDYGDYGDYGDYDDDF
jgi:phospholipid-binding lipoprotein MlaA